MSVHGMEALVGWCTEVNQYVDARQPYGTTAFFDVEWSAGKWEITVFLTDFHEHPDQSMPDAGGGKRGWVRASGSAFPEALAAMMTKLEEVTERDESAGAAETGGRAGP